MITATSGTRQQHAVSIWQRELAQAVTDPAELLRLLAIDPVTAAALLEPARSAGLSFRLRVPHSFVRRMRRGDPHDPLLRQVLPLGEELKATPGFGADPVGEAAARRAPGLLQKYHGRALLVLTGACAVHCRYCFRREYPYSDDAHGESSGRWEEALAMLAADDSIEELILSGGDPLSLSNARLAQLSAALIRVPHLRRLRIHTRQPIVLPARVDAGFTQWLRTLPWPVIIVLHANHPQELDAEVNAAVANLRDSGATLLNQSVLLAGVNDSAPVLADLSRRLFDAGVLPYYLHLLDRVNGTAHFEVPEPRARHIAAELAALLPGYLVPRLAREVPEASAKLVLAPAFV
ncbi:MAG: EF-P beta-lysylation protein EpmB [Steroidobacteraceae bacterium]